MAWSKSLLTWEDIQIQLSVPTTYLYDPQTLETFGETKDSCTNQRSPSCKSTMSNVLSSTKESKRL